MSAFPPNKCGFCEEQSPDLKACSKCHLTPYCSKQCQRKDWNRHKQWCELLQGSVSLQHARDMNNGTKHNSGEHGTPEGKKKRKKKKKEPDMSPTVSSRQEKFACRWCQKVCDEPLKCSRCKKVTYCTQTCQRKDWLDGHQKECKPAVPVQPATIDDKSSTTQEEDVDRSGASLKSTDTQMEEENTTVCEWCQKYLDSPLRCSGCGKTAYCSEACQKKDWAYQHKKICDRSKLKANTTNGHGGKSTKPEGPVPTSESGAEHVKNDEALSMSCNWCQKFVDSPLKCSSCTKVVYCSGECQKKDWITEHQKVCERMKAKEKPASKARTEGPSGAEAVSSDTNKDGCLTCKKATKDMKRCARCKVVVYCSKTCQKQDWTRHKDECIIIDGVIKTKEYKKAEQEKAEQAARDRQPQPMSPLELMAQMMGFRMGAEQQRDASPRMSWTEAKRIVHVKYPGYQIVESFSDMPGEFLWMIPVTRNRVLLALITRFHHYQTRHSIYIRDVNGDESFVMFYLDFDNPHPYFSWSKVQPGNYICIENAIFHSFLDGTVGIRIDEAAEVRIL